MLLIDAFRKARSKVREYTSGLWDYFYDINNSHIASEEWATTATNLLMFNLEIIPTVLLTVPYVAQACMYKIKELAAGINTTMRSNTAKFIIANVVAAAFSYIAQQKIISKISEAISENPRAINLGPWQVYTGSAALVYAVVMFFRTATARPAPEPAVVAVIPATEPKPEPYNWNKSNAEILRQYARPEPSIVPTAQQTARAEKLRKNNFACGMR